MSIMFSLNYFFVYRQWLDDPETFSIMDHTLIFIVCLLRYVVIAIKYAYFSELHLDMLSSFDMGAELN